MSRYMLTSTFRDLSIVPGGDVDQIESLESGWVQRQIDRVGAKLDARLAKRYKTPFGGTPAPGHSERSDVPEIIEDWIVAIVTVRCYAKRGINPSSAEPWYTETVLAPAKQAADEIKEAASSVDGLFDLPLLESSGPNGAATRSGPMSYSETSPYAWIDEQWETGTAEDSAGTGTTFSRST